jgi:FkbM family methyltransferase
MLFRKFRSFLKRSANKFLRFVNFKIERDYSHKTIKIVLSNTDLVLDVGANTGQYVNKLRKLNYSGEIISIEPLLEAHTKLEENSKSDPHWIVLDPIAIGSEEGKIKINKSINLVSSSVLDMLPAHALAAPESHYVSQEDVKITTVSNVLHNLKIDSKSILLKIDTQGYEHEVLRGALSVMDQIRFIEVELSVQELYAGQKLYIELLNMLDKLNYKLISLEKSFEDKSNGTLLQFDAIFCKSGIFEDLFNKPMNAELWL